MKNAYQKLSVTLICRIKAQEVPCIREHKADWLSMRPRQKCFISDIRDFVA